MRILVACEESQEVCKAFRARGHEAYSCDLQECSGGHPEWHLQMDAHEAIELMEWDQIIMHPPCTKVCVSGNSTHANTWQRIDAANWNADLFNHAKRKCKRVAMENPVGVMNRIRPDLPKPNYVDLWWFGTREMKKTGWWLHGLKPLVADNVVGPPPKDSKERLKWQKIWMMSPGAERGKLRSKLDPNLARAMAEQWG
jgi:hypothetical protein